MKIFILGWFGAGNMGDEAILLAEVLYLRKRLPDAEFFLLSFNSERTRNLTQNIPEVKRIVTMGTPANLFKTDFRGIFRTFRQVDVVLIGGGGLFQNLYNRRPIPFFSAMAFVAKIVRKPLVYYCLGIGPLKGWIARRLTRYAIGLGNMISVRDEQSKQLLDLIGVRKPIYLSADPAFLLESEIPNPVEPPPVIFDSDPDRKRVLVCIHDLLSWRKEAKIRLAKVLDRLAEEIPAEILFLPLGGYQTGRRAKQDSVDLITSKQFILNMKMRPALIVDDLYPEDILGILNKSHLMISMRYHGLVLAMANAVPAIAVTIKSETKLTNLMTNTDQQEYLFDANLFDAEILLNKMKFLLAHPQQTLRQTRHDIAALRRSFVEFNQAMINYFHLQGYSHSTSQRKTDDTLSGIESE